MNKLALVLYVVLLMLPFEGLSAFGGLSAELADDPHPNLTQHIPECAADGDLSAVSIIEAIEVKDEDVYTGYGTAFLVEGGWWISAAHVVAPSFATNDKHIVHLYTDDDERIPATIVHIDLDTDIAILTADYKPKPLPISTRELKKEDLVHTSGFPHFSGDVRQTYSGGYIGATDSGGLLTDSFVFSGMSGGPGLICTGDTLEAFGVISSYTAWYRRIPLTLDGVDYSHKTERVSGESIIEPNIQQHVDAIDK